MRTFAHLPLLALAALPLLGTSTLQAQHPGTIGILYIDRSGVIPEPRELGGMARIEMEKTGRYNVIDWYEARETLAGLNIQPENCYGRSCLLQVGQALKADKMLMGSVERYGERIAITLKVLDVASGQVELSNTSEFQNVQPELQRMIEITVQRLVGIVPDKHLTDNLEAFNEPLDVPVAKANLSGPRFGLYYVDGSAGERLRGETKFGGFNMTSVTSMIGWQQEVQYVNSGDFQCLFEFLFTGSGLESGRFIPAFTFLNGFRLDRSGWEIAFGPTFRFVRKETGFYTGTDVNADWHLESEWPQYQDVLPTKPDMMSNLDSRGDVYMTAGLVIAVGKTLRSGQLNIPVNAYLIPRKEGNTYGLSMGFNVFHAKKH